MLDGILILWAVLTLLSLIFVIYDVIKVTPEAGVMKVAWVLVILYAGPVGLFFYFMTCREPFPGAHEKFIRPLWKQAAGSEMHCLAGDATGIILAAIVLSFWSVPTGWEVFIEYMAGFGFGLFIFQALFMKKMMGGTYLKALKNAFFPEWLSMNMIMAGMIPVMVIWGVFDPLARDPSSLHFWGKMSLATIVGGLVAYSTNYWLVSRGLKHGMMTARKGKEAKMEHIEPKGPPVTPARLTVATLLTLIGLGAGITIAILGSYLL